MNPNGIIPPQEGVENLLTAKKLLEGNDISPSDINQAIIKTHGAVEKLFRTYLSQKEFIPNDIRGRADDPHETNFPDLINAMSDHGRPSLAPLKFEAQEFNRTRIPIAHATDDGNLKDALRGIGFAEKVYSQYSQVDLPKSKFGLVSQKSSNLPEKTEPRKIMNPFVDEPEKAHFLTKYPSDDNYRVVWVKGKKAEVSEKGLFPCPIWKFNRVARVWLHERALPVDLSAANFFSSDKLAIEVQVDLIAQVKETDRALIAVTTSFNESFELLRTDVTSIVRKFCNTRQADAIHGAEKNLVGDILNEMSSAISSSLFNIKGASVCFRIPFLEEAAQRVADGTIGFEDARRRQKQAADLAELKNASALSDLVAELEREAKRVDVECAKRTANARTDREIKAADLDNLKSNIELTEKYKTAMFHFDPACYERLESARITNDPEMMKKAREEMKEIFNAVGGTVKRAGAIVIEHTK